MRSNDLRKLIVSELNSISTNTGVTNVYYDVVPEDAMYPHIVFSISGVDLGDLNRRDYSIDIDIYTKNTVDGMDIADRVEDLFLAKNAPQSTILPTFYLMSRITVEDPDKSIKHTVVRLTVQQYDKEV